MLARAEEPKSKKQERSGDGSRGGNVEVNRERPVKKICEDFSNRCMCRPQKCKKNFNFAEAQGWLISKLSPESRISYSYSPKCTRI